MSDEKRRQADEDPSVSPDHSNSPSPVREEIGMLADQPPLEQPGHASHVPVANSSATEGADESEGRALSAEQLAVRAELEMIGPMWYQSIWTEHPEASEEQVSAFLNRQLNLSTRLIPHRWTTEPPFKEACRAAEELRVNLERVLYDLKTKDVSDRSARIEDRQATQLVEDWTNVRLPNLDRSYQEVIKVWFKPGDDPLTKIFSDLKNKFANLIARLDYERSERPALRKEVTAPVSVTDSIRQGGERKNMVQFDAAKLVQAFAGDTNDPDVLLNFSNWKSAWNSVVQEMETLRGFNQTTLFQKLKSVLSGPALLLVSRYSSESHNSYEAAMNDLIEKYQDPITLAGTYINNGIQARESAGEQAEAIRHAFKALSNMRDVFEREKVDMYDFALMRTFITALPVDVQAKWNTYKVQKKQDYVLKCEGALKEGNVLPNWQAGMVENRDQFDAWLRLISVKFHQPVVRSESRTSSTASNFAISQSLKKRTPEQECFLCPEGSGHCLSRCPRGLGMSLKMWRSVCREKGRCFTCANPHQHGHTCRDSCRICRGKQRNAAHHVLMCPINSFRTHPLEEKEEVSRSKQGPLKPRTRRQGSKWPNENQIEGPLAKWAKDITAQMKSLNKQVKESHKDKPQKSDQKEK